MLALPRAEHESGEPLRRDCSCRGGSGWAHFSCLVDYAKQKAQQWDGFDVNDFVDPWRGCPGCKQRYQNELAIDLAEQFVSFVEEKHPQKHLDALLMKLFALLQGGPDRLRPQQKKEANQVASKMLSIIERMKVAEPPPLPKDTLCFFEARVYTCLGDIAVGEGTKESAKTASGYYEKCRDICDQIGDAEGVTFAESNIAQTKYMCEGMSIENNEETLKKQQTLHKHLLEKCGQENIETTTTGLNLAVCLKHAHHGIEAERLTTKLVAISKRVLGSDHNVTKRAESLLFNFQERFVGLVGADGIQSFQALRYEEDGEKCVLQGPVANPRYIPAEKTFPVASTYLMFCQGTPVICHGFKMSTHLNGKIGDLRPLQKESGNAAVHFDDESLEPHLVVPKNMRILFDLPEHGE